MKRRNFIRNSALATIGMTPMSNLPDFPNRVNRKFAKIRFGICADLHQDIMHDAAQRLEAFIDDMQHQKPDFIIQLGDFCRPYEHNQPILNVFNRFSGPRYHVIGNHDMDGGFTREQVVAYWKAKGTYYSFDIKGYHFVVLDGNEENPSPGRPSGYARWIGPSQLKWLQEDLDKTNLPTIVFCHQGLDNDYGGLENGTQSRLVLERANERAGFRKVQLVFSGHHHQDYRNYINGIHYIQINSMSYQWLGSKYAHIRYSEAIDKSHPWIKSTAPYKDPLWAMVELLPDGQLSLKGRKTVYVGPSPEELGMPEYEYGYLNRPLISDRKLLLTMKSFR